ncbi:MAG: DUF3467 domain-containing protein [Candidatus Glassbacteria bacterium]
MPRQKKKSNQLDKKRLATYEGKDITVNFSDYVEVKLSTEQVLLSFCQRNPDDPENRAEVISRIYMTIPHYVRFVKLGQENLKKLQELGILIQGEEEK